MKKLKFWYNPFLYTTLIDLGGMILFLYLIFSNSFHITNPIITTLLLCFIILIFMFRLIFASMSLMLFSNLKLLRGSMYSINLDIIQYKRAGRYFAKNKKEIHPLLIEILNQRNFPEDNIKNLKSHKNIAKQTYKKTILLLEFIYKAGYTLRDFPIILHEVITVSEAVDIFAKVYLDN